MKTAYRIILSTLIFIAGFTIINIFLGAVIAGKYEIITNTLSIVPPAFLTIYIWKKTSTIKADIAAYTILGGLIAGSVSFLAGFFGPILLAPSAEQGPLLGIFITGPIGFVIGLIMGGLYGYKKLGKNN